MSLLETLLDAYIAPEMAAQKQAQYEADAPMRTAAAWNEVLEKSKPKPDTAGSLYERQNGNTEQGSVVNALTQSLPAKQAHQALTPKQSPAERMNQQLNLMMESGDPTLQKKAMELYGKEPATQKRSASAQIAMDIGLTPGTPAFEKFVRSHSMKAGTTVNMGGKAGYLTEEEKKYGGLDPDAPFVWGKNGIPQPVKTSGFTESQQKAHGFYDRMIGSGKVFNDLEDQGFDPSTYQQKISNLIPLGFGSKFMTPDQQTYSTAAIDWARSKLRFESGAVIGDKEAADEAKLYFPQPGDAPEVIKLKRSLRRTAERAMLQASGRQPKAENKNTKTSVTDDEPDTTRVWKEGDGPVEGVFWAKEE